MLDRELLNEKTDHGGAIHTGVYVTPNRQTAIVVRSKAGKVAYLTLDTGTVQLREAFAYTFAREYPLRLPNYPTNRALRGYMHAGLPIDALAGKVFRAVFGASC